MLVRYIIITLSGRVYEYRTNDKMAVLTKINLGIDHSVKDIGFHDKEDLKKIYPGKPIYFETADEIPFWLKKEIKDRVKLAATLKSDIKRNI